MTREREREKRKALTVEWCRADEQLRKVDCCREREQRDILTAEKGDCWRVEQSRDLQREEQIGSEPIRAKQRRKAAG